MAEDHDIELATRDFPRTADGLTYGSDAEADSEDEAPDLIAVTTDDGRPGFVRKPDLYADHGVTSPEEAVQYERRLAEGWRPPPLDVWDLEGTRIGSFTPQAGNQDAS